MTTTGRSEDVSNCDGSPVQSPQPSTEFRAALVGCVSNKDSFRGSRHRHRVRAVSAAPIEWLSVRCLDSSGIRTLLPVLRDSRPSAGGSYELGNAPGSLQGSPIVLYRSFRRSRSYDPGQASSGRGSSRVDLLHRGRLRREEF